MARSPKKMRTKIGVKYGVTLGFLTIVSFVGYVCLLILSLQLRGDDIADVILLRILPALVVLTMLGTLLLTFYLIRNVRQINSLTRTVAAIRKADYDRRAQHVTSDELGRLALMLNVTLDHMMTLIQPEAEKEQVQSAIQALLGEVSAAADGNLTVKAAVNGHITDALADSFNMLLYELRETLLEMKKATSDVGATMVGAYAQTEALAKNSRAQSLRMSKASSKVGNMAVTMQRIADASGRAATIGSRVSQANQNGNGAIQNTLVVMEQMRGQVQETSKRLKRLGESSQEIGTIVRSIGDLADRTGVLALNASIQASTSSGGGGFGMVAHEIEQLAEQARALTRNAENLIKNIQAETAEAVEAMEATTSEVVEGSKRANEADRILSESARITTDLDKLLASIAKASGTQANETESLAQAMGDIAASLQRSAAGGKDAVDAFDEMTNHTDELRRMIGQYKLTERVNGAHRL